MAVVKRRRSNGSIAYGVQAFRDGEHVWVGTRDTMREAKQLEREELSRKTTHGRETVAQFVDRYVSDFNYGGDRWAEDSEQNLRYALKRFAQDFGTVKLARFPTREALPWASRQPESVVRAVRAMFNDAVRSELAPSNPFAGLGLERSRGRADIVALTEEELNLLAELALARCGAFSETMHAFVLFQGYVGCRPKETSKLRRRDIDFDNGTVYVSPSKNGKARTILLPPQPTRALLRLPEDEWLFVTPQGSKLTKTNITYWWNKCRGSFEEKLDPRRAAELRDARPRGGDIQLYELRHTAATILLERGVTPEDVAWQLGHTDGGTLVRTLYGHPTEAGRMQRVREAFLMETEV